MSDPNIVPLWLLKLAGDVFVSRYLTASWQPECWCLVDEFTCPKHAEVLEVLSDE